VDALCHDAIGALKYRFYPNRDLLIIGCLASFSDAAKPAPAAAARDPGIGNSQLWFKYHEGASNAVRRTVHVRDFL